MQTAVENELGAVLGIVIGRDDRPSREHLGETRDVVLAVAGAHTERVQLQDLTREILVEAAGAIDAGHRVGPDGNEIVEVDQHGRVALDREQHVDVAPEDVRPDRFALIATRHVRYPLRGHAEMVRPEPDEALGKADLGGERGIELGFDLFENGLAFRGGGLVGLRRRGLRRVGTLSGVVAHVLTAAPQPFGLLPLAFCDDLLSASRGARFKSGACGLGAGRESRIVDAADAGTLQLGEQRTARIGCDCRDRARTRSQAEPVQRKRGVSSEIIGHGASPMELAAEAVARRALA